VNTRSQEGSGASTADVDRSVARHLVPVLIPLVLNIPSPSGAAESGIWSTPRLRLLHERTCRTLPLSP
jgi:hypothetical protein